MFRWIFSPLRKDKTNIYGDRFQLDAKMIRKGLDRKLSVRIFVAIFCTAILSLTIIAPTYRDFTFARQNLFDIQHYRLILDTANLIAAERGPANIVMSEGVSSDGADAKRLRDIRSQVDAALDRLAAISEAPFGLHDHPIPFDNIAHVHANLVTARAKVDRLASVPNSVLKREAFQDAIEAMFAVSDSFRTIVAWRADQLVDHDTSLAAPALVGEMLTDLRDYGGRIASQIMAPLATKEPLPFQNIIESRQTQGRLLQIWQVISSRSTLYDNASLLQKRAAIEDQFFGEGVPLIIDLILEGHFERRYSPTVAELTHRFVPTMRSIEAYRTDFLDAAVAYYAQARATALTTLIVVFLITCAIFAILVGLVLSIQTQIFRPLLQAHQAVLSLAKDAPDPGQQQPVKAGEIRSLFGALEVLREKLQERASVASRLRAEADTDDLTALLNRRAFGRIAHTFAAGNEQREVCLILMDIDHFKHVNDTWGHPTGDRVLIQTAELLRSHLRSGDIVARFGGEEFAILLPRGDLSAAISIGRKLRLALQNERFTTTNGTPFCVSASFGVARGGSGPVSWPSLLEKADDALYRAKSEGRNRVRFVRNSFLLAKSPVGSSAPDRSYTK